MLAALPFTCHHRRTFSWRACIAQYSELALSSDQPDSRPPSDSWPLNQSLMALAILAFSFFPNLGARSDTVGTSQRILRTAVHRKFDLTESRLGKNGPVVRPVPRVDGCAHHAFNDSEFFPSKCESDAQGS